MANVRYSHKRKQWKLEPREFAYVYHYARMYEIWARDYAILKGMDVEPEALRRLAIRERMEPIEQAALEADGDLYGWILSAAVKGHTWPTLEAKGIPCSRATYYRKRRKFYYSLYQRIKS